VGLSDCYLGASKKCLDREHTEVEMDIDMKSSPNGYVLACGSSTVATAIAVQRLTSARIFYSPPYP
jgi:hypothetical protein